jgi:hypothetical protein
VPHGARSVHPHPPIRPDAVVRREAERFMADSHAVGLSIGVLHRGRVHRYGSALPI